MPGKSAWLNSLPGMSNGKPQRQTESCAISGAEMHNVFDGLRQVISVKCSIVSGENSVSALYRYAEGIGLIERTYEMKSREGPYLVR